MLSKKWSILVAALLVGTTLLTACGGAPQVVTVEVTKIVEGEQVSVVVTATPPPPAKEMRPNVLHLNFGPGDVPTIDPALSTDTSSVQVVDDKGRPVAEAAVTVDCPEDQQGLAVHRSLAVTGQQGLTPKDAEGRALVITRRELRPTDNPLQPQEVTYSFRLRVAAPGFAPKETRFAGASLPALPIRVILSR